jgi:hypothetical protein
MYKRELMRFKIGTKKVGKPKVSSVQLVGGLGNQLFCYAFGLYLQEAKGHKVVFDTSEIDRGLTKHGVSIDSLELPGIFRNLRKEGSLTSYYTRRVSFAIQARIPFIAVPAFFWPCYTAKEVGWDPGHETVRPGTTFRGYFASTRYFNWLRERGGTFGVVVANPSEFYSSARASLLSERFLAVHVRRGDFVGLGEKFGLVGPNYFINAIQHLRDIGADWEKVVVFSDDINAARNLLEVALKGESVQFLEPPPGSDDAESMALMALGSHHVISNSSFSLWAALLSESQGRVIAPEPWHKGMKAPTGLLPDSWITLEPNFQ